MKFLKGFNNLFYNGSSDRYVFYNGLSRCVLYFKIKFKCLDDGLCVQNKWSYCGIYGPRLKLRDNNGL